METYQKTYFEDSPSTTTPITAEELNKIGDGIKAVTDETIDLEEEIAAARGTYQNLNERLAHTSAPTDEQVAEVVENYLDENPLTENISNKKTSISGQSQTGDSNTNYPTVGAVRNFVNNKLDDLQEYLEEYIDEIIIGGVENGSY